MTARLLLLVAQLWLATPTLTAKPGGGKPLFFYVDTAAAPELQAAPSHPQPLLQVLKSPRLYELQQPPIKVQVAQGTQVSPRLSPGQFLNGHIDFNRVQNQSPIVSEDRVSPGSVYHQRVYHNQQKIPLISFNRAQAQPRNTFFSASPREDPRNLGFQPSRQINRPSSLAQEEDDKEEEEEDEEEPENLEEEDGEADDDDDDESANEEESTLENSEPENDEEDDDDADEVEKYFFEPRAKFSKFKYETDEEEPEEGASKHHVKYHKVKGNKGKRAGKAVIQGGYSQKVPVAHKQKIYKERWYLSKDLEDQK